MALGNVWLYLVQYSTLKDKHILYQVLMRIIKGEIGSVTITRVYIKLFISRAICYTCAMK